MKDYDHELKTIQPWFGMVWNNKKPFEIRVNDRDFQVGQRVLLREYDPDTDTHGPRAVSIQIVSIMPLSDILTMFDETVDENIVIMSTETVARITGGNH